MVACLQDGSIDPGDFQQVTQGLMTIIRGMPEYQDVVKFTRASRQEYSALYRELAAASDDEYTAFVELNQQSAIEMMTEALFGLLVKHGLLVDKRGHAPVHAVPARVNPEVERLQVELDRNRASGDHVKAAFEQARTLKG